MRARYLTVDLRTLGLFRIVIGTLLCFNCLRVWTDARLYFSNEGVFSNDWHLFRPSSEFNFSLLHSFSSTPEVHVAFALAFICFFLFAIGYRTRLFNALSLLWITSFDNRLVMVENGGYVVVNLATFWALFLPVGARYGVDAFRRAWRAAPRAIEGLETISRPVGPHRSLAAFLLLVNFGAVYIFNVVNKYGTTWREGKTVHYVLHLDRLGTPLAAWFREHLPFVATQIITWSVLVVEAMIVMLIFWPSGRRYTRPLAQLLIVGLHVTFGVMMQLGPFSWFMIGWSTALVCAVHWEAMARFWRDEIAPVEVSLEAASGAGIWLARILAIADGPGRLRYSSHSGGSVFRARRLGTDWCDGPRGFWLAARATPWGRMVSWMRLPSLGALDLALRLLVGSPRLGRFLGLEPPEPAAPSAPMPPSPSPARLRLELWGLRLREAITWLFVLIFASQMINENKSIPEILKHQQPKAVRAIVLYPRLFQGWGMFAPNPVREDGVLAVEAITRDGRRVDPLRKGREPDLDLSDDRGCGLTQIHQDYGNRIRQDRNKVHRQALERFLQSYHRYTQNPDDELVYYAVWWLRDQCPEPGSLRPTDHERICLAGWRKPGFRPPQGIVLPKVCKVASAGD